MKVGECTCELLKDDPGFFQSEQVTVEQMLKCSTLHIGYSQVILSSIFTGIQTRNKMLMFQGLHDLSFTIEHIPINSRAANDFDS
jgi:hypothetical protein